MKLRRNDPCHCGSGKKYKKCCLPFELGGDRPTDSELHNVIVQSGSGTVADIIISGHVTTNFLKANNGESLLCFDLITETDFRVMATDASFIFLSSLEPITFAAAYDPREDFPFVRVYRLSYGFNVFDISVAPEIQGRSLAMLRDISASDNYVTIEEANRRYDILLETFHDRIKRFKESDFYQETDIYNQLFQGRNQQGIANKAFYIFDDRCCVCRSKLEEKTLSSTTSNGIMASFPLCLGCRSIADALGMTTVEFISQSYGVPIPIKSKSMSQDEVVDLTKKYLPKLLEATLIPSKQPNTVALKTKDNLTLYLRLTAPLNYAYIISDEYGKRKQIFDSSNHHGEALKIGPDHHHNHITSKRSNGPAEESYLTGMPLQDVWAIKRALQEERNARRKKLAGE